MFIASRQHQQRMKVLFPRPLVDVTTTPTSSERYH